MYQLIAIFIAFLFIPILIKLKLKLSYALLISTVILGILSGIPLAVLKQNVSSIVTNPSSLNTVLTVMMVAVLGGVMKHYGIINVIIETMSLLIKDKRKILAITPALMGVLIMPGGALLSAPFVYELGNEMGLKPSRSAVINLVFRHLAMFIFPYSTSLLVISATIPELNIFRLILFDLAFVFAIVTLGYICFLKDIKVTKLQSVKNVKQNLLRLIIYTSPIYVCIIINLITGLPFYITLLGSILMVYILSNKKDFLHVVAEAFNKNTLITILTVATILILKEIVLHMDGLFGILQSVIIVSRDSILTTMLFFIASSFVLGFITGFDTTALAIVLPFMAQFNITGNLIYVFTYFIFGAGFIGYYFSPLHLCQAFTVERMGVSTSEIYKEYRIYMPLLLLFLIVSTLLFYMVFGF